MIYECFCLRYENIICWFSFLFWIWDLFGFTVNLIADHYGPGAPAPGSTGGGPAELRWRSGTSSQGIEFGGKLGFFGFIIYGVLRLLCHLLAVCPWASYLA